jgi:phosphatidylserine decarboxylase
MRPVTWDDVTTALARFFLQEDLNFLVTNRIPRRALTRLVGWYSAIESPRLTRWSIRTWALFSDDLRLDEAKRSSFASLQECFTRELREGARPIDGDPGVVVSPCDAEVGAFGPICGTELIQAKGFPYTLEDLVGDPSLAERHRNGQFVTLRLKSNMYHRFHAPMDARVERVTYHSGDTWNVNPIALRRVERLFCKNERAVIELVPEANETERVTMVAVASILVASIKLHCIDHVLDLRYRGPNVQWPRREPVEKGDELGYFQSGSTIILCASGPLSFTENVIGGATIRVGQPLLRRIKKGESS